MDAEAPWAFCRAPVPTQGRRCRFSFLSISYFQAQFGLDADELWWPGTVHKLRKGGCVDIAYDDGDFEKRKPLFRVRPLP